MRFTEFLKINVLLSAGGATLLAAITLIAASDDLNDVLVYVSAGWWTTAVFFGIWIGRRAEVTPPIARLLSSARTQSMLPELRPGRTLINRLWPLLFLILATGGIVFVFPQVTAIAAGFCIIWALSWRRQSSAVLAIEERDAARFYIDRISPFSPIRLIRTPGFGGSFLKQSLKQQKQ